MLALAVLVIGAAAAVNFYVMPLEVLAAWRAPVALSIATDPNGGALRLDGVPLSGAAPITVSVRRDRADHVIEAARVGFQPAREIVRYDKSVGLAFVLRLEKDPAAAAPATADGGTTSTGADGGPAARTPTP